MPGHTHIATVGQGSGSVANFATSIPVGTRLGKIAASTLTHSHTASVSVGLSQTAHSHTFQVPGHNHTVTTTSTSTSIDSTVATSTNTSDSFSVIPSSAECLRKMLYKVRPRKADVPKIKGCDYMFDKVAPAAATITATSNDVSTSTTTDTAGEPFV